MTQLSCDMSCDLSHIPLHYLRNKENKKKKNQIKENKLKKKKIKIKYKSSSIL